MTCGKFKLALSNTLKLPVTAVVVVFSMKSEYHTEVTSNYSSSCLLDKAARSLVVLRAWQHQELQAARQGLLGAILACASEDLVGGRDIGEAKLGVTADDAGD